MKTFFLITLTTGLLLLFVSKLQGQEKEYITHKTEGKLPVIDGILQDEAWNSVEWGGDFIQNEPADGKQPTLPTFFKILYDNDNIYIAIKAIDPEPGKISKRLTRRDVSDGDKVGVYLDSYFDRLTAFCFIVNAAGVKIDYTLSNDENSDMTWDPIWFVKTHITHEGWQAEIKIPFSQLRFSKNQEQTWGLQVVRRLFRNEELSSWKHIPRHSSGYVSQFGLLKGIRNIRPKKEIELLPYVMTSLERSQKEDDNPFQTGHAEHLTAGLDGKIAVTNDITLNFTINPDFGQVEADPSEVNLTAYETFFEEKRPFFIEGKNIFNYKLNIGDGNLSNDNLFYSRRIGRLPHHDPEIEDHEFIKIPTETSILGAFKLSGKTRSGISVGVMEVLTGMEKATIDDEGVQRKLTVEPLTNYFLTRLQKDFNKGNTILGGMITSTDRDLCESHLKYLPGSAVSGGLDFAKYWHNKDYYISAKGVFSKVSGTKEAIKELQESPVRYFQRPDASHIKLDSNRTSLAGHGGTLEFGKLGGGHFQFLSWVSWRRPGLELNDMGYLRQADEIQQIMWAGYRIFNPTWIFRFFSLNANQYKGFDFSGLQKYSGYNTNFNGQFLNYWSFGLGVNRDESGFAVNELRGGPALRNPGGISNWYYIETDNRKNLKFSANYSHYWGDQQYCDFDDYSLSMVYRPNNAISITLSPTYNKGYNDLQYVTDLSWNNNKRYIVSNIVRKEISTVIRFDISLTPELTIQYYGQPFVFSAHYHDYKMVTSPRAKEVKNQYFAYTKDQLTYNSDGNLFDVDENLDGTIDYSFDNPDFSFFQFRSNLVIRWEFLPGSTAFLVWSQGRTGDDTVGRISYQKGMNDLFNIYPHNIFLFKISYRIHT
ncbi:MAG: DUF5916 domain-containing protein [Bacteroidales bacterium]